MDSLLKVLKNPLGLTGVLLILFWAVIALSAPALCPPAHADAPYAIARISYSSIPAAPSAKAWLGTTGGGYDILYGIVWGSRNAFRVGLVVVSVSGLAMGQVG